MEIKSCIKDGMKQDCASLVKNFLDVAIGTGFGTAFSYEAMRGTLAAAPQTVNSLLANNWIHGDAFVHLKDASMFLYHHSTAGAALWAAATGLYLYHSIRKIQAQQTAARQPSQTYPQVRP